MCLTSRTLDILIADRDIFVYKIIDCNNLSMHKMFPYKPNTLYRLRKALNPLRCNFSMLYKVYNGFHSFITKPREYYCFHKVVEFTIPKGARYMIGLYGDIVSTSIRSGSLERI